VQIENFSIAVLQNTNLEYERRNVFIMDNKQGSTTCSFLDITDGSQHEVKTTDNTDWLLIEDFGQVNRRLVESLGQ